MTPNIADVVIATRGRDAGKRFFVVGIEGELALIADGRTRRLERPKRKKGKHLSPTRFSGGRVADKLMRGERVTNGELRRALASLGGPEEA